MPNHLMDIADIATMLGDRIDPLVAHILPNAVRDGHEWRIGSIAGEAGRSMAIHTGGSRAGVWKDFSDSRYGGDALDLVAYVLFAGDKKKAIAWAKSWLGLDNADPARLQQDRAQIKKQQAANTQKDIDEANRKIQQARAIWFNAVENLQSTPVDLYLLGRGIGLNDLKRPPGAIRYAPALTYPGGDIYPAMVAGITNDAGKMVAVHRTFLKNHGGGLVTKAPVDKAKMVLGSYRGGCISLSRGASGRPLRHAPEGDHVILCEGIEDGLSLALCVPEYRILAAISVSNFKNIVLPAAIQTVTLAFDNDGENSPAHIAAMQAVQIFQDQGRDVFIARSPEGKDFNDCLVADLGIDACGVHA